MLPEECGSEAPTTRVIFLYLLQNFVLPEEREVDEVGDLLWREDALLGAHGAGPACVRSLGEGLGSDLHEETQSRISFC